MCVLSNYKQNMYNKKENENDMLIRRDHAYACLLFPKSISNYDIHV